MCVKLCMVSCTLTKIKSTSVTVNFLSRIPQSVQSFLNLEPSSSCWSCTTQSIAQQLQSAYTGSQFAFRASEPCITHRAGSVASETEEQTLEVASLQKVLLSVVAPSLAGTMFYFNAGMQTSFWQPKLASQRKCSCFAGQQRHRNVETQTSVPEP